MAGSNIPTHSAPQATHKNIKNLVAIIEWQLPWSPLVEGDEQPYWLHGKSS